MVDLHLSSLVRRGTGSKRHSSDSHKSKTGTAEAGPEATPRADSPYEKRKGRSLLSWRHARSSSRSPKQSVVLRKSSQDFDKEANALKDSDNKLSGLTLADLVSGDGSTSNNGKGNGSGLDSSRGSSSANSEVYPEGESVSDLEEASDDDSEIYESPLKDYAFHSMALFVKDMDTTLRFYKDLLGMEVVHMVDNESFYTFFIGFPEVTSSGSRGDAIIFGRARNLIQLIAIKEGDEDPDNQILHSRGFEHLTVTVPNVRKALRRFSRMGCRVIEDGTNIRDFGAILDPDGYKIQIMSRDQGSDEWLRRRVHAVMNIPPQERFDKAMRDLEVARRELDSLAASPNKRTAPRSQEDAEAPNGKVPPVLDG